jgi:hypothetical protein
MPVETTRALTHVLRRETAEAGMGIVEAEAAPLLYRASVPVFLAVLARLAATLARAEAALGPRVDEALLTRPAPGMLPAGRQIATAAQFTLRVAFPLAGRRPPELRGGLDAAGLRGRIDEARALLAALPPAAFDGAETRPVRAQAGLAHLELAGEAFLHGFGLPNLYFHHAMAHVALKHAGVPLGKADFDGLHEYPKGFSFG